MDNNMYNQQDTNQGQFTNQYQDQNAGQNAGQNYYPQQNVYQQNGNYNSNLEEPVTMGEWVISLLLICIPCVNLIMMFVWAFSKSEKKSKSNFFKAALIFYAIALVLSFVVYGSVAASVFSAVNGMY